MDGQPGELRAPVRTVLLTAALHALVVTGCAGPGDAVTRVAEEHDLSSSIVHGEGYRHAVYQTPVEDGDPLLVYFDGDGRPWIDGRRIARDPTTKAPVALELMVASGGAAAYVGRPCYGPVNDDAGCSPRLWTDDRYSGEVVMSLVAATRDIIRQRDAERVVLVGYSGGGVLATLVAPHLDEVIGIVTVAANVDIDGWTRIHGYRPLSGSLNPATTNDWPPGLPAWHYAGDDDENVPVSLSREAAARHEDWRLAVVPGYDHRCCWAAEWPRLLPPALEWIMTSPKASSMTAENTRPLPVRSERGH